MEATGHQRLESLSIEELKALRSASRSLRILGWSLCLLLVVATLALVAIAVFVISTGSGGVLDFVRGLGILWVVYAIFAVLVVLGTWKGVCRGTEWGRVCLIVLLVLMCLVVPIGTLIGIGGFMVMKGAGPFFGKNRIDHREIDRAFSERKA